MVKFGFILVTILSAVSGSSGTVNETNAAGSNIVTYSTAYNPDVDNVYHLFTRDNPLRSQPLLLWNEDLVRSSNYNPRRRTIYLIHGWIDSVRALFNVILVPAFLEAEDVNVIALDWEKGAWAFGETSYQNTVSSGLSGARFINWLNSITGASINDYHVLGYSLGSHQAAVLARNVDGQLPYVHALDPANTMHNSEHFFSPDVAAYTEAIHTNSEGQGYGFPLAHADFYPNGGNLMPRCDDDDVLCQHESCFIYMAESLKTEWIASECATYEDARAGACDGPGTLRMGGLRPKTGATGLYYVKINGGSINSAVVMLNILVGVLLYVL